MNVLSGFWFMLAASVISVPTPPGVPSADVTAHHGSVYQTASDGKMTQGFFEIDNAGPADELTGVTCAIADNTSLVGADGKLVSALPIPARHNVVLAPSGVHLLLQNLHFSVQYGGIVPCSLTLTGAGAVSVFLYATKAP